MNLLVVIFLMRMTQCCGATCRGLTDNWAGHASDVGCMLAWLVPVAPEWIWKWGGHQSGVKVGANFFWLCPSTFLWL